MGNFKVIENGAVKKCLEFICLIFFSPICSLLIILLVLLSVPLVIYRTFVSLLGRFHPDLDKLIPPRFASMATDDMYGDQKYSLIVCQMVEGKIDLEWLRKTFLENVMEATNEKELLKYSELKQYPFQWMGYLFWKWEEKFDINQHIKYYEDGRFQKDFKVTQEQLRQIELELVVKPYKKNTSPWEILVVHNVESEDGDGEERSMMYLLFHHCLGDAFALMKMERHITTMEEKERENLVNPANMEKLSKCRVLFTLFYGIIVSPYQFFKLAITSFDRHDWRLSKKKQFEAKEFSSVSAKIPVDTLKKVAKVYNVGVTAVIYALYTASVRKAMLKKNITVPKNIHVGLALPMPGHPDKLRNHVSGYVLELPTGENDSRKRLMMIYGNLREIKRSLAPFVAFYLLTLLGCIFPLIFKLICGQPATFTAITSCVAGLKTSVKLNGHEMTDAHALILPGLVKFGLQLLTLSYCEKLRMTITVNSAILDNQRDVDEMQKSMVEELLILSDGAAIAENKVEPNDIV